MTLDIGRYSIIATQWNHGQSSPYIVWPNVEHDVGYTALQFGAWRVELVWTSRGTS